MFMSSDEFYRKNASQMLCDPFSRIGQIISNMNRLTLDVLNSTRLWKHPLFRLCATAGFHVTIAIFFDSKNKWAKYSLAVVKAENQTNLIFFRIGLWCATRRYLLFLLFWLYFVIEFFPLLWKQLYGRKIYNNKVTIVHANINNKNAVCVCVWSINTKNQNTFTGKEAIALDSIRYRNFEKWPWHYVKHCNKKYVSEMPDILRHEKLFNPMKNIRKLWIVTI